MSKSELSNHGSEYESASDDEYCEPLVISHPMEEFNPDLETLNKLNEQQIEKLIEDEQQAYSKTKFSKVDLTEFMRGPGKTSMKTLNTISSRIDDDITIRHEEIRFENMENSQYELDENDKVYKKKVNFAKNTKLAVPGRSNTERGINSGEVEKRDFSSKNSKKSVSFSTQKIVYSYDEVVLPDYEDYVKMKEKQSKFNVKTTIMEDSASDQDLGEDSDKDFPEDK